MFLAPPDSNDQASNLQNQLTGLNKLISDLNLEFTRFTTTRMPGEVLEEMYKLNLSADALNKGFMGARTQLVEMGRAVADAAPGVLSMGGKFTDVADTLNKIALGSRRNVIAATEDVKDLFAVGALMGKQVNDIVANFSKAGISYNKISKDVGESIQMINHIGLNARTVMSEVLDNTEQLQRFNFENGVKGLAKMAAQASMLRFDMAQTFKLADDVLDPERAIEVASAFQRLGVSAGNLVDPFQLMNQSINDPSGLQDSLINISKQFTYFDEKSKSYKINPQGILTLRELEKQTGVSAKALRDAAIQAADFDERLAAVNKSKLFPDMSEDDKKLLANMARMGTGEGAEYEVSIGGKFEKLSQLNSDQLKQVVEEQKKSPKDVQEIQKNQLDIQESLLASVREINQKLSKSLIANEKNLEGTINMSEIIRNAARGGAGIGFGDDFNRRIQELQEKRKTATDEEKKTIDLDIEKLIKDQFELVGNAYKNTIGTEFDKRKYDQEVAKKLTEPIDQLLKQFGGGMSGGRGGKRGTTTTPGTIAPGPSAMINPDWLRGRATSLATTTGTGFTGGLGTSPTAKIDVKFPDKLPPIYIEKGPSMKDTDLIGLVSKGGVQLGESIFKLVEETAQRLGKESRLS